MEKQTNRKCATCDHFIATASDRGECRVNPPRMIGELTHDGQYLPSGTDEQAAVWPKVQGWDWCSKWRNLSAHGKGGIRP